MSCLSGLVGLKCSKGGSDTGASYYLSELPAIHLAGAVQIADHEQGSGEALLRESIAFSEKIVLADFAQRLRAKNLVILETIETTIAGTHGDTYQTALPTTIGVYLEKVDRSDPYVMGSLNYIELKVEDPVVGLVLTLEIDGALIDPLTVDLEAGVNRISLGLKFSTTALVEFPTSSLSLSLGEIRSNYAYDRTCCDNCGYCLNILGLRDGSTSSTLVPGVIVSASCGGDIEAIACSFSESLALPLLYRSGAHVMETLISSHRPNPYVRNTKEEASILYARWMGGNDPQTGFQIIGEYPRFLDQVVAGTITALMGSNSRAFGQGNIKAVSTVTPLYRPRRELRKKANYNKF